MAASLLHAGIVTVAGQVATKVGAVETAKVELHVAVATHPPPALSAVSANV